MTRKPAAHLVPPGVVQAAIELVYGSQGSCAKALGVVQTNLANFLKGRPTLGVAKRDRLYAALGLGAWGKPRFRGVLDLTVRDGLGPLTIYLEHLGASRERRFCLVMLRQAHGGGHGPITSPDSLFAIESVNVGWRDEMKPAYRLRVHYRPRGPTPRVSPENVPCLQWAHPATVTLPAEVYAAWTAKKRTDAKDFDAAVSASKVTWDDFVNYFAVDLGLTVDGAFSYVEYLQAKEDAAKRRERVLNIAARVKAKRESNDGE